MIVCIVPLPWISFIDFLSLSLFITLSFLLSHYLSFSLSFLFIILPPFSLSWLLSLFRVFMSYDLLLAPFSPSNYLHSSSALFSFLIYSLRKWIILILSNFEKFSSDLGPCTSWWNCVRVENYLMRSLIMLREGWERYILYFISHVYHNDISRSTYYHLM